MYKRNHQTMSLPDLSKLGTLPPQQPGAQGAPGGIPAKPTEAGNDRFFYLLHRPSDGGPRPAKAAEIVESGGVKPWSRIKEIDPEILKAFYEMREQRTGKPVPSDDGKFNEYGMDTSVVSFMMEALDLNAGAHSAKQKGRVAWYYLNVYDKKPILALASESELVFRVPFAWLEKHAVSCVENPVRDDGRYCNYAPWSFLTTEVVPLTYRIVSSSPVQREDERVVSNFDIGMYLYDRHVATGQPLVRNAEHATIVQRELREGSQGATEGAGARHPRVNPF